MLSVASVQHICSSLVPSAENDHLVNTDTLAKFKCRQSLYDIVVLEGVCTVTKFKYWPQ